MTSGLLWGIHAFWVLLRGVMSHATVLCKCTIACGRFEDSMTYGSIDSFLLQYNRWNNSARKYVEWLQPFYSPVIPEREPCVHLLQNAGVPGVKLVPASVAADMKDEWMLLLLQYSAL